MQIISKQEAKELGLKKFYTGLACSKGHFSERYTLSSDCCQCSKERISKWKSSPKNIKKVKDRDKLRYIANKELWAKRSKEWRIQNPDKQKENARNYQRKVNATTEGKLKTFIKNTLKRTLSNNKRFDLVGYTETELKIHIENLWAEGMSWDNYGTSSDSWSIDHIKPVNVFIKEGVSDVSIINALSNLQPLWVPDNSRKSDKWEELN